MSIHAKSVLTPDGWKHNVRISIADGRISALEPDTGAQSGDEQHAILLPGMANLHSHAFQRAMAGLAEIRGASTDNFWSWRDIMYRFALSMSPDQMEAIAAQLYVEMLEAGFTRVGEFHYLHHAPDGRPYANIGELAGRIAASASETGIGLTLLPVFYAHSGFGGLAPGDGQRRFINDPESFAAILGAAQQAVKPLANPVAGIAPHSLRAVTPQELKDLQTLDFEGPIHIHVAEQVREVEDCLRWSGARPVEWLLDNVAPGHRWCFIHATHMTAEETRRMAQAGAIAGLCPVTEANLGDGTFPAPDFISQGGHFGIGSDSNGLIGIPDELRQLEYSQRLLHLQRNVLCQEGKSTGRTLFDAAVRGGAAATGIKAGLAVGLPMDCVSLALHHPVGYRDDAILDHWIFANGAKVDTVWVAGQKQVSQGQHRHRQTIADRFAKAMTQLMETL